MIWEESEKYKRVNIQNLERKKQYEGKPISK